MSQYKLMICEKPSVAQSIAAVIGATVKKDGYMEGNGYIVSWCIGHLVELADASVYNEKYAKWNYGDLPILPDTWQYAVPAAKKKQYNILASLMNEKRVDSIICATDAGREGELIFRLVYQQAGCKKNGGRLPPFERLWISSMEDNAIRAGFKNLKPGMDYDNLYASALCRSQADWLVGINATRLFSVLYGASLNVGRVQSPTLAMLVERDKQIKSFTKEKYWRVNINLGGVDAVFDNIKIKAKADNIAAICNNKQAVVSSIKSEKKSISPPRLFDLTSLQRETDRIYGYTAQQTLDCAQSLYEYNVSGKLTDKRFELMLAEYEQEQTDLEKSIIQLQAELDSFNADSARTDSFLSLIRKYTDFAELTPTMIGEFIEKIIVYEADRSSGEREQDVDIYLNFIGKFDVPIPEPTPEEIAAEEQARLDRARRREYQRRYREKQRRKEQDALNNPDNSVEQKTA